MDEQPLEPGRFARAAFATFGVAVLLAAVPIGFYGLMLAAVLVGGWHGVTPRPVDWAAGLALLAFPLLMLALAAASLLRSTGRRLVPVAALVAALAFDGGVGLYFLHLGGQPEPPSSAVTTYPDVESAEAARKGLAPGPSAKAVGGPQTVSVACSPVTGKCASTTTKPK
jgi:hypothetical protein